MQRNAVDQNLLDRVGLPYHQAPNSKVYTGPQRTASMKGPRCTPEVRVQHPISPVEMGVVVPLLKGRGHSPVGRNRETRKENGEPITTAPLHAPVDDLPQ